MAGSIYNTGIYTGAGCKTDISGTATVGTASASRPEAGKPGRETQVGILTVFPRKHKQSPRSSASSQMAARDPASNVEPWTAATSRSRSQHASC
jgi:hypothetical protein